ncbi:MAG TPA: hypothetical protein DCY03_12755 [Planctomycetaceae bacterium]|nr:hypothetical protein [Planctomycetaceae bacterium]
MHALHRRFIYFAHFSARSVAESMQSAATRRAACSCPSASSRRICCRHSAVSSAAALSQRSIV